MFVSNTCLSSQSLTKNCEAHELHLLLQPFWPVQPSKESTEFDKAAVIQRKSDSSEINKFAVKLKHSSQLISP